MARSKSHSAESGSPNDVGGNELITQLLQKIAELESRLDNNQIQHKPEEIEDQDNFNQIKINSEDYIKVVNLYDGKLNLSTERNGQGKIYVFSRFGEVKRIIYLDLVKIIESNRTFLEDGYFYIMDKRCIRRHGLEDVYDKLLTKENIESILNGKTNDVVSLFKSANKVQQEIIINMLVEKIQNNPDSIDLNLVDKISRASGVKIQERADEGRELQKILNSEDEE